MNKHHHKSDFFIARLRGSEEVPPVRTNAIGFAQFKISSDEKSIRYQLEVNNLRNFTQAHIHIGERGENGPVVVFLFGPVDPGISVTQGVIEGTITKNDLVGPLSGKPLSALIKLIRDGRTYVNAHTVQNPDGEIRGQIKPYQSKIKN
ncbi:CHRD domain-containing protein [Bacillus gobiensis]|uniref:CHRD domain-containing protein n=1 Tax=Bacillus gobiensis TaxID=1441095 RepID=UPI003D2521B2